MISECVTDLANALLKSKDWDPKTLRAPIQDKIPKAKSLPDDIPFKQALPMIVDVPEEDAKADVYIDDTTTCCVNVDDNK